VVADLAVEGSALAYQVAAVADEELQGSPSFVAAGFQEGAAGDGARWMAARSVSSVLLPGSTG
jgi:hypothetical protein